MAISTCVVAALLMLCGIGLGDTDVVFKSAVENSSSPLGSEAYSATPVTTFVTTANTVENTPNRDATKDVRFEDLTWTGRRGLVLSLAQFDDQPALHIETARPDSLAIARGVTFEKGIIEMDIACEGRMAPTIFLGITRAGNKFDRVILKPLPRRDGDPEARLQRAVVTQNDHTSVVLNFRQTDVQNSHDYERTRWFHVKLVIDDALCYFYLDHDLEPALVLNNTFHRGRIGVGGGRCFVSNVRISK